MLAITHAPAARHAPPPLRCVRARAEAADTRDMQLADASPAPRFMLPMFRNLSEVFGPKLPADIVYETVSVGHAVLDALQPFQCSYDEGFGGHFSVPGKSCAALNFDRVMTQPDPIAFLKEHMRFHPACGTIAGTAADEEMVIFSPGLNTLHMIRPGWEKERTTPQRLQRYVDILQRPMAQLHIGTDMDQGPAVVLNLSDRALAFLRMCQPLLRRIGFDPAVLDNTVELSRAHRDYLEAAMSQVGYARPLFQAHVLRLLEFNETAQRPLVLMPYSRTTGEVGGALRQYKAGFIKRYTEKHAFMARFRARGAVEELLRQTLTVVSYGNIEMRWPDGPAYIHVSCLSDRPEGRGTDMLTGKIGVNRERTRFAGEDAVFLNFDGMYSGAEPHNLGAVGVQGIRIAMNLNGVDTFRGLWEKGQQRPLQVPTLEQIRAAAVVMDSAPWLFAPDSAFDDVDLPSPAEAEKVLEGVW